MTKQKKPRKRIMTRGLKVSLIVFLTAMALALAAVLQSYLFHVETIEVEGLETLDKQEIIDLSGIKIGDDLLFISESAVAENLKQQPYAELVEIRRSLPDTVILEIRERKADIAIKYGESYAYLDTDGLVLQINSTLGEGKTEVLGLELNAAVVGEQAKSSDDYLMTVLQQVLKSLEENDLLSEIQRIDLQQPSAIMLYTTQGLGVRLGNSENLDKKMQWLTTLLPRMIEEGKRNGILDVSSGNSASYIIE